MPMPSAIPLDDPLWKKLTHAYGKASDVPPILQSLADGAMLDEDEWGEFFNTLCHQGSVYQAAYAALPHLIESAKQFTGLEQLFVLDLAAAIIACSEYGKSPKVNAKLQPGFKDALIKGRELAADVVRTFDSSDEKDLLHFLGGVAAFIGQPPVAAMLWNLDMIHCPKCEELIETCPNCGAEFNAMELYSRDF